MQYLQRDEWAVVINLRPGEARRAPAGPSRPRLGAGAEPGAWGGAA